MNKFCKRDILLWGISTFCLAFCMLAMNDLAMLRSFGKWDGLWYYFCPSEYLITLDKIFILLATSTFIVLFTVLVQKYRWYALFVFVAALPGFIVLLALHVFILYIIH